MDQTTIIGSSLGGVGFVTAFGFIYNLLKSKVSVPDYQKRNDYIDRDLKDLRNNKLDIALYKSDKKAFDSSLKRIENSLERFEISTTSVRDSLHSLEKQNLTNISQTENLSNSLNKLEILISTFLSEFKELRGFNNKTENDLIELKTKLENCNGYGANRNNK